MRSWFWIGGANAKPSNVSIGHGNDYFRVSVKRSSTQRQDNKRIDSCGGYASRMTTAYNSESTR